MRSGRPLRGRTPLGGISEPCEMMPLWGPPKKGGDSAESDLAHGVSAACLRDSQSAIVLQSALVTFQRVGTHTYVRSRMRGGRALAGWRRSKKSWQQDGGAEAGDSALPLARRPRCRRRRPLDVRLTPRAGSGERANCSFPWPGTGIGVRVCLLRPRKGVKSEKKKKGRESGRPSVIQDTHSQCNE